MKFGMPHLPFMGKPLSAHTLIILTDSGKRAVYSLNGSELKMNFHILQALEGRGGSMTILQIARELHTSDVEDLKIRLRQLKQAGYVRFAGEEMAYQMPQEEA